MAIQIWFTSNDGECDKCKKPATLDRPIVHLQQAGRKWQDKNYIMIHEDCLFKAVTKLKSERALERINGVEITTEGL